MVNGVLTLSEVGIENEQQDGEVSMTADVLCPTTTACLSGGFEEGVGSPVGWSVTYQRDGVCSLISGAKFTRELFYLNTTKSLMYSPFLLNCLYPTPFPQHLYPHDLVQKLQDALTPF